MENYYLLKNLEITRLLTKNLKQSNYLADNLIKNNLYNDFRVEISFNEGPPTA